MSTSDNDRYVVEQRQVRRDWEVVSERQFTGNPDDAETGMIPRLLDHCWEYMGHRQGRRRVVPAKRENPMAVSGPGEFQVNDFNLLTWWGDQLRPFVAAASAGNFVVVWDSFSSYTDYSYSSV